MLIGHGALASALERQPFTYVGRPVFGRINVEPFGEIDVPGLRPEEVRTVVAFAMAPDGIPHREIYETVAIGQYNEAGSYPVWLAICGKNGDVDVVVDKLPSYGAEMERLLRRWLGEVCPCKLDEQLRDVVSRGRDTKDGMNSYGLVYFLPREEERTVVTLLIEFHDGRALGTSDV